MMNYSIPLLPLQQDIETKPVLKKLALARAALAELKGAADAIPNEVIILNTLSLQEAKDSSAIENIITTHDELYSSDSIARQFTSTAAKEVHNYATALKEGFKVVKQTGLITSNHILQIQSTLEENNAGFRKLPGTALKNQQTGEVVYTPPQHIDEITKLMTNLESFCNDASLCDWDVLVKMAVIHHQFESIHPFYDGNGRTGRIINILYLVKEDLLNLPILYLSRYINQNKGAYYRLLQQTRITQHWEPWVLFILDAVEKTALQTSSLVRGIKAMMLGHKQKIRTALPKVYSQDLINNLFQHPYTKIDFLVKELGVTRKTAAKYLEELCRINVLTKHRLGKDNYYLNNDLFNLLSNVGTLKVEDEEVAPIRTLHG